MVNFDIKVVVPFFFSIFENFRPKRQWYFFYFLKGLVFVQVCAALKKMSSVLRLGVYRERIEKYGIYNPGLKSGSGTRGSVGGGGTQSEQILTVTLERQPGLHLGIR